MRRLALAVAALLGLPSCRRGCAGDSAPPEPARAEPAEPAPVTRSARCVTEIARAAVALPPGTGAVDAVIPTCARGTLALYVARGHVLSRVARPTAAGGGFEAALVVSTGVDRVGPVASDAIDGPIAWRSPTAGLDEHERDDVWAAVITRGDAGLAVSRGDALMPEGVAGIGVPVPAGRTREGLSVYATVAREGVAPSTSRVSVTPGRDEPDEVRALAAEIPGELKAWEASRAVALSRVEEPDGAAFLEATWAQGGARARHRLASRYALVSARGARVGERSAFLVGEFALGGGDAGACMTLGGGLCVRPGPLYLLVAGAPGAALERLDVAAAGLPDSLAARGFEATVLYLAPDDDPRAPGPSQRPSQRAARVRVDRGEVAPLALTPPEGFGAIDGPALVACDDGVWLAAEITVSRGEGDAGSATAVTALPLECLTR